MHHLEYSKYHLLRSESIATVQAARKLVDVLVPGLLQRLATVFSDNMVPFHT